MACIICSVGSAKADLWPNFFEEYARAKILSIEDIDKSIYDGREFFKQELHVQILSGEYKDEQVAITHEYQTKDMNQKFSVGDVVAIEKVRRVDGKPEFYVNEKYRLPWLIVLFALFVGVALLTGGWKGLRSLGGFIVSILILVVFIVPQIIAGKNPLLISLIGSSLIACFSIYLAHGYNRRTRIALWSTLFTLVIALLLAMVFVHLSSLFGMGSEEVYFFDGRLKNVNLQGLLLGGIVIGALGVLDDITTAQTATVDELSKANPKLSFGELYQRGMSVGREHVASLINTLALAYAGASMPLLILLYNDTYTPLWIILNAEFLAEEIVRTLVGSTALLLAVPISTWLAARSFQHGHHSDVTTPHACSCHHHV